MFEKIIKNFQKKLVNLSGSNRALLLLKLSKENDFDISETDFLLGKPAFQLIQDLIAGKAKIPISNFIDSRNEKVNLAGKRLQKINRKDKFLFDESGSKDLHIGWPLVQGKFSDGSSVRCPLLFFPVALIMEKNLWFILQDESEPLFFNKSFLLAWKHYNKSPLQEDFENFSFDSFPKDALEFRTKLYELLKSSGIELNFNSELFTDKLEAFKDYKSSEFADSHEIGRLKLHNQAILGIFPQASSYLLPDYDQLIEGNKFDQFEDFFNRNQDKEIRSPIKEADILTPLLIDAPQEEAIKLVKSGKSIVVQGPPGTGKSQMISNLVSDFISKGKRVLVVCQKKAALEVVFKRLHTLDVGPFIALVHDFKSDRNRLYNQIGSQIDLIEEFKNENSKLNTVVLERDFLESCKKIDQVISELQEFKDALFNESECGFSVKELYLNCQRNLSLFPDNELYFKYFERENLNSVVEKFKYLLPYAIRFSIPGYAFFERKSFKNYNNSDKSKILSELKEMEKLNLSFQDVKKKFNLGAKDFYRLEPSIPILTQVLNETKNQVFYSHFQLYSSSKYSLSKIGLLRKKVDKLRIEIDNFVKKDLAIGVETSFLANAIQITSNAANKFETFMSRIIWNWSSKDKNHLLKLLDSNQLSLNKDGLTELYLRLSNLQSFQILKNELELSKDFEFGNADTPQDFNEVFIHVLNSIILAEQFLIFKNELPETILPRRNEFKEYRSNLKLFVDSVQKTVDSYKTYSFYFTNSQLDCLFDEIDFGTHVEILNNDFDSLVEFDKEVEKLNFEEKLALEDALQVYNSIKTSSDQLIVHFENAIKLSWINLIEAKNPILTAVSTSKISLLEEQLNSAIENKRKLSAQILLLKLREQAYKNEEFNRLGNSTTFRDLKHQVTKKKKIWPLRKTIESYIDELFYLMPCWMASPETVSAIFPLKEIFDIVIFDEASQCFAEKGLPAIARAKQLVITGDSKQLPPSDIYSARFEEDNELPDTEINSLLDLASRYLPQVMLTEHYRSRSLDLIDFSNKHFYKGKLKLLPDYKTFKSGFKGIEFVKTHGIFDNRQNIPEAEKVVELCFELIRSDESKEIGIITFNLNQQNLIQDLIEQRLIYENRTMPVGLIIKNIENIQGDEKDIIIFSIGYAPDISGKMNHQFGSLNMEGGENRLNVAITRAREKVIVVSSINPQQLNVENAMHEGPKLLKKYLEYALNVSEGRFVVASESQYNRFNPEWFLKNKLKKRNNFKEEFPFADISELDDVGSFKQLILTDDEMFFNSLSIKESFSYLPATLKGKDWKYERMFSRNYRHI